MEHTMTPNIYKENKERLDITIDNLLDLLREIESDEFGTTGTLNDYVGYIIDSILERIYTYNDDVMASAIGLLELTKVRFVNKHVLPIINQSEFDSQL